MTAPAIEYGATTAYGTTPEQVRLKLRNAPAWVHERVHRVSPHMAPAAPPTGPRSPAALRWAGWLAGTCCPGISRPTKSQKDPFEVREQFSDVCMQMMLRQVRSGERPVTVTLGHGGPVIASSRGLAVMFRMHPLFGLVFDARLPDTELGRRVAKEAADGAGVSIGYFCKRQHIIDRDGVGEVRVIHEALLDHVAVLPRSSDRSPCFTGARAFAMESKQLACPREIRKRAELVAYRLLKEQAGCPV